MYTHEELKRKVIKWSSERGMDRYDNHPKQIMKLIEETGELCDALLKNKKDDIRDAIGDIYVVLEILCDQINEDPKACYNLAWEEIKDRKGKTINGTFIKNS